MLSCDRFSRSFEIPPEVTFEGFVETFVREASEHLRARDISAIMSYYTDGYVNNHQDKTDMVAFYTRDWTAEAEISVTAIRNTSKRFALRISDPGIDVDVAWEDTAGIVSNTIRWIGDGVFETEPVALVLLAEVFTALTCRFCPLYVDKLAELSEIYSSELIYIKYHIGDSLRVEDDFSRERTYYSSQSQPTIIFQGQTKLTNTNAATINSFDEIVADFLSMEPEMTISDLTFSLADRVITGAVTLSFDDIDISDLYLMMAVYQETTDAMMIFASPGNPRKPATHVVRGRAFQPLVALASSGRVSFEFTSEQYIATDSYLVVWVQRMADINAMGGNDKVLNAVKVKIK
jgi:hypothetical protein